MPAPLPLPSSSTSIPQSYLPKKLPPPPPLPTKTTKNTTTTTPTTSTPTPTAATAVVDASDPLADLSHITSSPILHDLYVKLIKSFLDRGLERSALFHSERFFAVVNGVVGGGGDVKGLGLGLGELKCGNGSDGNGAMTSQPTVHPPHATTTTTTAHTARHLYALSLLLLNQTYSALSLVNGPNSLLLPSTSNENDNSNERQISEVCKGCLEIKARCCIKLGRWRQAREALEGITITTTGMNGLADLDLNTTMASSLSPSTIQCKAGTAALHGNMPHKAGQSFREALRNEPLMWEAWEGLCSLGDAPDVNEVFPIRGVPVPPPNFPKRGTTQTQASTQTMGIPIPIDSFKQGEDSTSTTCHSNLDLDLDLNSNYTSNSTSTGPTITLMKPITTGTGFFTPDSHVPHQHQQQQQPMASGVGNLFRQTRVPMRDSLASSANDTCFFNTTEPVLTPLQVPMGVGVTSRPLSSADESGRVTKRLRSEMDGNGNVGGGGAVMAAGIVANLRTRAGKGEGNATTATANGNGNGGTKKTRVRPNVGGVGRGGGTGTGLGRGSGGKAGGQTQTQTQTQGQRVITRRSWRLMSGSGTKMKKMDEEKTRAQEREAEEAYEYSLGEYYIYVITRTFAQAQVELSSFRCMECLSTLSRLPGGHQSSALSLSLIGRAHYEVQDYRSSERAFKALRWKDQYRVWDMEVYSSLLWQMGRGVELAFLAREMVDVAPWSGEAWIVVGNLFSERKERERALGCFKRAGELAKSGSGVKAYAYTLCGHESLEEDLSGAVGWFERALREDGGGRHYGAWYGLGTCYLRMGKARMAEYHFRRAVGVNGASAVLLGCVGMAVERRGERREEALGWFERAVDVSEGRNALVRFRRAKIYVLLRRYEEAMKDLEYLKDVTPDESNVIFQLAMLYRLIGDQVKSAQMLAAARDISPKSLRKITRLLDIELV